MEESIDYTQRNILHERTPLDSWLESLSWGEVRSFYLIPNY